MNTEQWKPVVGMERFYDVSNRGRVKSKHRIGRRPKGGVLSLSSNTKGYRRIRLSGCGRCFSIVVHRLVLEAFIGPPPSQLHQTNHKNGIKSDNNVTNLEWVTPTQNNHHAMSNGLWLPNLGEAHGRAKLHASDIPVIRALQGKESSVAIGKRYGVSSAAITLIWRRINWKHIPETQ